MFCERLSIVALIGLLAIAPFSDQRGIGSVRRMSDVVVVGENEEIADDLIAIARELRVAGTVQGDVLVFADRLVVSGVVEGDIVGFARRADIGGEVAGSVRLTGGTAEVRGRVGEDVTSALVRLHVSGRVDRDVYSAGNELEVTGEVGRDVAGRFRERVLLSGNVGRDLEPVTPVLVVTEGASVGGTVVVWPGTETAISDEAEIGSMAERTAGGSQLQVRAAFLLIRLLAAIMFVLVGVAMFWLFPRSLQRAESRVRTRAPTALLWGLLVAAIPITLVIVTVAVAAFAPVLMAAPALAVLIPATLLIGSLALLLALLAPVPVLSAAGRVLLRGRATPVAGFVLAAVLWVVVASLPLVGTFVAAAVVVLGLGAWVSGSWMARGDPTWAFTAGTEDAPSEGSDRLTEE